MRRPIAVFIVLTIAAGVQLAAAQTRAAPPRRAAPAPSSEAAAGRQIFDSQCAWCHGNEGDGGTGPNLHGRLRHATTLASMVDIITSGIPGTDMPSFRGPLTERSIRQAAAYVQSLSRTSARPAHGNAEHGIALYEQTGCASCHAIDGRGGILGPELTSIGSRRGAAHLREALVKPAAGASARLSRGPRGSGERPGDPRHPRERGRLLDSHPRCERRRAHTAEIGPEERRPRDRRVADAVVRLATLRRRSRRSRRVSDNTPRREVMTRTRAAIVVAVAQDG